MLICAGTNQVYSHIACVQERISMLIRPLFERVSVLTRRLCAGTHHRAHVLLVCRNKRSTDLWHFLQERITGMGESNASIYVNCRLLSCFDDHNDVCMDCRFIEVPQGH